MATIEQVLSATRSRLAAAKFVVMCGKRPYYNVLCTYPAEECLGDRDPAEPVPMLWNPPGDGLNVHADISGFASIEAARAALALVVDGTPDAYIVALPIRIRRMPPVCGESASYYDPELSRVV